MASQVSICNQALLLLGDKTIQSLTENTREAEVANAFYQDSRDHVLRDIKPNFAIRRAPPGASSPGLNPVLPVTYPLPSATAVVLGVYTQEQDPSTPWVVEGPSIASEIAITQIVYITREEGLEATFDSSFTKALAAYLAAEFSYSLTGSQPKLAELMQLYTMRKEDAMTIYGMESSTKITYNQQLMVGRF
jgi:hypothetical protein